LKICFVANGESVHTRKWVKYFADGGYDVHLVTFDKTEEIKGVKVRKLRYFSRFAYPLRILNVIKTVNEIDPDIVHAHYISHYGMYGALVGFRPFVVTAWGSDILVDPRRSLIREYFAKYVLTRASLVTVDSQSLIRHVMDFGVCQERIKLICHGVDWKFFGPPVEKTELRDDLDIPVSSHVVISTRSLEPIYDVETLVKAIPIVLRSNADARFIIVGKGSLKNKLEVMVSNLGVSSNVEFVGQVSQTEVSRLLGLSDVYVSTSLSDTTSVSLLEAMACGLPVVVTELEGNIEWIKEGVNGFLFSKSDSKMLADRITYLLSDENIRKRFGAANRKIVLERADYEKEMKKMEDLYNNLIEEYST
jgi:glycosyltransferase involved in cell wall biosynthesis